MNLDSITFCILVPVYKVEKYIRNCIESVLSQTYQNFRLILVDDGSPDNCGKICDEYAERDNRISVVHQKNMGALAARCTGVSVAKRICDDNTYFTFLDSDDSLKSNALQTIYDNISDTGCDLIIYGLNRIQNGNIIKPKKDDFTGIVSDKSQLYHLVFENASYNTLWRKAILSKLIHETDYSMCYHIFRSEDLLQSIPIYGECEKVSFIGDKLYNYNQVSTSITHTVRYDGYKVDSTVRKAVWDFLKSEKVWSEEDYTEYLKYCRKLVKDMIREISEFDVELTKKSELFQQINADGYYSMVIASAPKNDIIFNLFSKGNYGAVTAFFVLRRKLANMYHLIKR